MNSLFSILVGVVLVLGVGGFVFMQKSANEASQPINTNLESSNSWSDAQVPSQNANPPAMLSEDDEDKDDDAPAEAPASTNGAAGAPAASSGITAGTIASHNTRASCWSSINGSVYDLTSWIPKHPGGEQAILGLCGTDGSAKFNRKHGGDASKEKILFGFKIGALAQ